MRYHPFRHLGLKALAVLLASVLWFTVAGEHIVERSLRVPLEFRNIPDAMEIVGNAPDSVDVRVRGASAVLSRVQPGEIMAVLIPLSSIAVQGFHHFTVRNRVEVPVDEIDGFHRSRRRADRHDLIHTRLYLFPGLQIDDRNRNH